MRYVKAMSLFANIGIHEILLRREGVSFIAACEKDENKADCYHKMFPETKMVCADIQNPETKAKLIRTGREAKIDLIIITPPCQGMSSAGKRLSDDIRNVLIKDGVEIAKMIKPAFLLFENVKQELTTRIEDDDGSLIPIPEYIQRELGPDYRFNLGDLTDRSLDRRRVLNTADFGVCQSRERCFILATRRTRSRVWEFPEPSDRRLTLKDVLWDVPSLDPFVKDLNETCRNRFFPDFERKRLVGLEVSRYHVPPVHTRRHVFPLILTPPGADAFSNPKIYRPFKQDGNKAEKYGLQRQAWYGQANTVLQGNSSPTGKYSVHPGRRIFIPGFETCPPMWSDPRTFTTYELMLIFSIPGNFNIPEGCPITFFRKAIGEGIPPKMAAELVKSMPK